MIDKIKQYAQTVISVFIAGGLIWGSLAYFTPAEAFRQHIKESRIEYLISTTTQYELQYKCFRESCIPKMPALLYTKYKEMYLELDRLTEGK